MSAAAGQETGLGWGRDPSVATAKLENQGYFRRLCMLLNGDDDDSVRVLSCSVEA